MLLLALIVWINNDPNQDRSPDQSQTKVLGNLLHRSEHGTELGWLIDPDEETVLLVLPD